jgi:hypothetical protein
MMMSQLQVGLRSSNNLDEGRGIVKDSQKFLRYLDIKRCGTMPAAWAFIQQMQQIRPAVWRAFLPSLQARRIHHSPFTHSQWVEWALMGTAAQCP